MTPKAIEQAKRGGIPIGIGGSPNPALEIEPIPNGNYRQGISNPKGEGVFLTVTTVLKQNHTINFLC